MKNKTTRKLHRDLGYFYVGLIISFAFSGILMNHRDSWHPEKYTVETKTIAIAPLTEEAATQKAAEDLAQQFAEGDKMRRQTVKDGSWRISLEQHDIEIKLATGKGEVVSFSKTPFISQAMGLHKNSSNWWIYYGDIFGISLIIIACTGMFMITAGKFSFRKRGWKLALAGIVFPLIVLFILT